MAAAAVAVVTESAVEERYWRWKAVDLRLRVSTQMVSSPASAAAAAVVVVVAAVGTAGEEPVAAVYLDCTGSAAQRASRKQKSPTLAGTRK